MEGGRGGWNRWKNDYLGLIIIDGSRCPPELGTGGPVAHASLGIKRKGPSGSGKEVRSVCGSFFYLMVCWKVLRSLVSDV